MIQRIQTLFLLAAAGFIITLLFTSVTTLDHLGAAVSISPFNTGEIEGVNIAKSTGITYYTIALIISAIISFVSIFLYRNRELQLRACSFNMVLQIGLQIFVGFILYRGNTLIEQLNTSAPGSSAGMTYSVFNCFPIVAMILTFLAFRYILKDELLIKSLNRIR